MIHIIITEDDPMVMAINRKILEKHPRVRIEKTFSNGKETLEYLKEQPVDLLFLDIYMPGMTGLEVLTEIRKLNLEVDVIMITAANDLPSISQAIRLGIIDYLVKPFDINRLQAALEKYLTTHDTLKKSAGKDTCCQRDIDRLIGLQSPKAPAHAQTISAELDKGLHPKTLERVIAFLRQASEPVTSSQIGEQIGISRITVRKYLNYLEGQNKIDSQVDYDTGGRPRILYFWAK
ncbi:MAG: response regulator [Lachnospiraceae bacterium]|nr:response regulator [Lachnospiraceae bacterium]